MFVVRFYWTDPDGHIHFPPDEVECLDDEDAIAKATARLGLGRKGWNIEIWDRARRIAKLRATASSCANGAGTKAQETAAPAGTPTWTPFHVQVPERLGIK